MTTHDHLMAAKRMTIHDDFMTAEGRSIP